MLRLGYHPATYVQHGLDPAEALADIALARWDGFEWSPGQLRQHFGDATDLRERLGPLDLELSGLYCPCGFSDDNEITAWHKRIDAAIELALPLGDPFIMIDGGSLDLPPTAATIDAIARQADAAGRRVRDAGLTCTWHQHWGTLFQYPAEFDALMAAADPELVRCTPDTAQLALGGFDLPATFLKHLTRLSYVHFKDLDENRRFIELGRGRVDFPPLAKMLTDAGFDGWIIVDLDYTSFDPRESSRANLGYLLSTLGLRGRRTSDAG